MRSPGTAAFWSLTVWLLVTVSIWADAPAPVSCATSTCHGGVIDRGPAWNHALATWAALDPHAGAGLLLRDEDSRAIVIRLEPAAADSVEAFDTVLRNRCISCHTTATAQQCRQTGLLSDSFLATGVSCSSCHGDAQQWLGPHVQADWSGPRRFEPETGMRDTESIIGRAETCVRCHIGSRTDDGMVRDMNHDLIAAGHPVLRFDLLLYCDNLPKHWDAAGAVEQAFQDSAIRVRSVSRALNLAAAASLAAERASDHLKDRTAAPWPELADYDCFACHQALSMREYRTSPRKGAKSPLHVSDGLPVWNAWHTVSNDFDLRENRQALETLSPHLSDPAKIADIGKRIESKYRKLAQTRLSAPVDPAQKLLAIRRQLEQSAPLDWHQAAIQYLDIDAALRDLPKQHPSQTIAAQARELIRAAERSLRFDPEGDAGAPPRVFSPATFDPEAFRKQVLSVLNLRSN